VLTQKYVIMKSNNTSFSRDDEIHFRCFRNNSKLKPPRDSEGPSRDYLRKLDVDGVVKKDNQSGLSIFPVTSMLFVGALVIVI
jgi:hypothetical protein